MYSLTRSQIVIDILHAHGLCVPFDRILRTTQGLGEAILNLRKKEDAVGPRYLSTGLFTIGAEDTFIRTLDVLYQNTTIMVHVFQFPS